jgi:UDP-glucose 4-epimerase/UDP-arabinose 4-epimerase
MVAAVRVLVTGGAGYIGSFVCRALAARGHDPVTLDNLSTGNRSAVRWGELIVGDVCDMGRLNLGKIEACIHLAGRSIVAESFRRHRDYYRANVEATKTLALLCGVPIVFASSCAIYDAGSSPYASQKMMGEAILQRWARDRTTVLRLFNVAGAATDESLGEERLIETHLIPRAVRAALTGSQLAVNGNARRDYVHVEDVAEAFCLALETSWRGTCDIGSGRLTRTYEVLSEVERQCGPIAKIPGDRDGEISDVPAANPCNSFGWEPTGKSRLPYIVETTKCWLSR